MQGIFGFGGDQGAERGGEGGGGAGGVPAGEGGALEVVQAEAGLQLAVVVLDPPADLGQPGQLGDGGVRREVRQPAIGGLIGFGRPFGQQPALRQAAIGRAGDVTVGGADPDGQEVTGHGSGGGGPGGLGAPPPGPPLDLIPAGDGEPAQGGGPGAGAGDPGPPPA